MKKYTGLFIFVLCMPMVMFGMNEGEGFAPDVAASLYGEDVSSGSQELNPDNHDDIENVNPNSVKRKWIDYQSDSYKFKIRLAPDKSNKRNCMQEKSERNIRPTLFDYAFLQGEREEGADRIAPRREQVEAYCAAIDDMNVRLAGLETREQRLADMQNLWDDIDMLTDDLERLIELKQAHGREPEDIEEVEEVNKNWMHEFDCLKLGINNQKPWTEKYLSKLRSALISCSDVVQEQLSFEQSGEEEEEKSN